MEIIKNTCLVQRFYIGDDGRFPNNEKLPVLHYKDVLQVDGLFAAMRIKRLFGNNNWSNFWQSGIYKYHHFHSITHEVLGVYKGQAKIILGGEDGITLLIKKGDVVIIPAGVAHKNLQAENDVMCVGAYPGGHAYDLKYGIYGERPDADVHIAKVKVPGTDPVFGDSGELWKFWR